jgi:Ca2+-binding RTX toxin-like protein
LRAEALASTGRPWVAGPEEQAKQGVSGEDDMIDAEQEDDEIESHLVFVSSDTGGGSEGAGGDPSLGATGSTPSNATAGLTININWDPSVANAPAGFQAAVNSVVQLFQSQFSDPITININVGYGEVNGQSLGSNTLGASITYLSSYTYAQIRNALSADAKTADDTTAVGTLPASDPIPGSHVFWLATAEAMALGLAGGSSLNGYVGFSSSASFDYDNSNGVTAGQYDFFGVVAHEITEVMGRQMMVGQTFQGQKAFELLDLFHYSSAGVRDFSGTQAGYFSINGGSTNLDSFNTNAGGDFGDWAASAGHDSFLAFSSSSVVNAVTETDLREMDVLGWNRVSSAQPDLTATNLVLNDTTVSYHITNVGTAAAAASTTGIYLSADTNINTADTLLTTFSTPSLTAGGSDNENVLLPLPGNLAPGTYYIGVIADYNGQIPESSEANNASNAVAIILGNTGDNTLTGTPGGDMILGLGGNDTLIGLGGNNVLNGGAGTDTVDYSAAPAAVTVNLATGTASNGYGGTDTFISIENVTGSAFNDLLIGDAGNNVLFGGAGDDTLIGGGGNDLLIGGAGTDTAVYAGAASNYTVISYNGTVAVLTHGAEGIDRLQDIENIQFADTTVAAGAAAAGAASAAAFDPWEYLASYSDLINAFGADAQAGFDHYLNFGFNEGRATNVFDPLEYLASNPDLINAFGLNPVAAEQHYVVFGLHEGRATHSFDPLEYLASNVDLINAFGLNPVAAEQHYVVFGLNEGRATHSFDPLEYLASNVDLINAFGLNPVAAEQHYVVFGLNEGRATHSFDPLEYLASNVDLIHAFGFNPVAAEQHYVQFGLHEGRATHSFDAAQYLANYADLRAAFGNDLAAAEQHYIVFGLNEGRTDHLLLV